LSRDPVIFNLVRLSTSLSSKIRSALTRVRRYPSCVKARARKEMHALAADYDAELVALRDEFNELARAHFLKCLNDAIDEAQIERAAMSPGTQGRGLPGERRPRAPER